MRTRTEPPAGTPRSSRSSGLTRSGAGATSAASAGSGPDGSTQVVEDPGRHQSERVAVGGRPRGARRARAGPASGAGRTGRSPSRRPAYPAPAPSPAVGDSASPARGRRALALDRLDAGEGDGIEWAVRPAGTKDTALARSGATTPSAAPGGVEHRRG